MRNIKLIPVLSALVILLVACRCSLNIGGDHKLHFCDVGIPRPGKQMHMAGREDMLFSDEFKPDVGAIYCFLVVDLPQPTHVKWVWFGKAMRQYLKRMPSQPFYRGDTAVFEHTFPGGQEMRIWSYISTDEGEEFPIGEYEIQVYIGNKLKETLRFRVVGY